MAKKVYTVEGVSVKLDPRIFADYEVNEIMAEMNIPLPKEDDPEYQKAATQAGIRGTRLVNLILGDQKKSVIDALRKKGDGFVSIDEVYTFIVKLIQQNADVKK